MYKLKPFQWDWGVIADFCCQTGPLTQLKRLGDLKQTYMGKDITKGGVQIPIYKTQNILEKGGWDKGEFLLKGSRVIANLVIKRRGLHLEGDTSWDDRSP